MEDEMHIASSWWGNPNREPQLKTGGGQERGTERAAALSRHRRYSKLENKWASRGLLKVTSQGTDTGRARPRFLPESIGCLWVIWPQDTASANVL